MEMKLTKLTTFILCIFVYGCSTTSPISHDEAKRYRTISEFLDFRTDQYLRGEKIAQDLYSYSATSSRFDILESDLKNFCNVSQGTFSYDAYSAQHAESIMRESFNAHMNFIEGKYQTGILALASPQSKEREKAELSIARINAGSMPPIVVNAIRHRALGQYSCKKDGQFIWQVTAVPYGVFRDGGGGMLASWSMWTGIKVAQLPGS